MVHGGQIAEVPSPLCSDGRRSGVAFASGVAPAAVAAVAMAFRSPPGDDWAATAVVLFLIVWNLFIVVYIVLTTRVFGGVGKTEFANRVAAREASRGRVARRLQPWGDGPTFAIEAAIVAFVVVLVLPHVKVIDTNDWVLAPVSLSLLLGCWGLSVVSYALHYAQHDLARPGLEFPGERSNAFADYVYFAIAVSTTFGATDVNITTPRMRNIVSLHTVLSFVYNSVIVALLVTVLIR